MNNTFIKTQDEDTAKLLREAGYIELAKEGNRWVFVNNDKIKVTMEVMKNVQLTDVLHF